MRVRLRFGAQEAVLTSSNSAGLTWQCEDPARHEALTTLTPTFRHAVPSHFPNVTVGVALEAARHFDGTIVAVEGLDSNETTS